MDPITIGMIGAGVLSGVQGAQRQKSGEKLQQRALEQSEYDYNMRAPLRRQGMQALGAVEGAYDMGNIGFNSANPFAAARGPAQSTAKIGNWDRFQTAPEQIDVALSGMRPDEFQFMQDALSGDYLGKSGGKQRFGSASGKEYTNDDRNHAKMLQDRYGHRMGFTGQTAQQTMDRAGIQPLGTTRPAPVARNAARRGVQPLGG
jgi:hypothetical protein